MKIAKYLLIWIILYVISCSYFSQDLIKFLDVGQGDAIFLNYSGTSILVDGGPSYLTHFNINNIDYPLCNLNYVFLTHPHLDHYAGLTRIVDRCRIDSFVFINPGSTSDKFSEFVNKTLSSKKINNIIESNLFAGDVILGSRFKVYVLRPAKEYIYSKKYMSDLNAMSYVLLFDIGEFEILLTGDGFSMK